MDTLPLPPDPAPSPPAPASAHREVIAAYDRITDVDSPGLWTTLRSLEDVLVDAKAVDDQGGLPLTGVIAVAEDTVDLAGLPTATRCPDRSAAALRRLIEEGAVVIGKIPAEGDGATDVVALGLVSMALATRPPDHPGVVGITPTAGLLPAAGAGAGRLTVVARTLEDGRRALDVMTDPAAWPDHVRLSAGERPRLAIPDGHWMAALPAEQQATFRHAVGELLVAGVVVDTVDFTPFRDAAKPAGVAETVHTGLGSPLADVALEGYAALMVPTGLDAGTATLGWPEVNAAGVRILARPFDDQIPLDLAALLTGEQLRNPYPATGIPLVVFGAHLRGQPLNGQLRDLGARFTGDVRTAPHFRMVALPDRQPGILPAADATDATDATDGAALLGERWLISPGGLGRFLAGLPAPMTLGAIDLEDGATAVGLCCQTPGPGAVDITEFGEWRAYLRHLTANRPGLG